MPETKLKFFGTLQESGWGTLRGLVALIVLGICNFPILLKVGWKNVKNNIILILIGGIVLCSAIAVQLPESIGEATLYGILVGFVVYSSIGIALKISCNNLSYFKTLAFVLIGMFSCGVASLVTYQIANAADWYPKN